MLQVLLQISPGQFGFLFRSTMWKVSKYGVFYGPNTGKYGPEITSYLDTFYTVAISLSRLAIGNFLIWLKKLSLSIAINKSVINLVYGINNQLMLICSIFWKSKLGLKYLLHLDSHYSEEKSRRILVVKILAENKNSVTSMTKINLSIQAYRKVERSQYLSY